MSKAFSKNSSYSQLLTTIKQKVRSAQIKAALAVNHSLIQLYWDMGKMIVENQALFDGRNNYVEQLANDLRAEFPEMVGFSKRNIFYCRKFYLFYSGVSVQQAVALKKKLSKKTSVQQIVAPEYSTSNDHGDGFYPELLSIPWGHHVVVLDKVKSVDEALFYLHHTLENNWSRSMLLLQLEQVLHKRQGQAISNFHETLPEKQALMARYILKDPYNFGFLTLEPDIQELELERQLTAHITKFLLELGKGFAFIGRQHPIHVGDKEYRIDLLFYHILLRCYIVIELKVVEFTPEFAGKMNFYLSVVDDQLKTPEDQPSIGIILCKNKNKLEVEYALRGMSKPIGVSEFVLTQALPAELKTTLPTIEEFENELNRDLK